MEEKTEEILNYFKVVTQDEISKNSQLDQEKLEKLKKNYKGHISHTHEEESVLLFS